ncbi:alpha-crystallin domain-containing protein 22.3-like [Capsicum chacoense]|uniref:alpha-crystallin domain-containing protein 22.3-like n=1 Tax=Capsicum annuum TaxID=4072 RepID=UPI001FB0F30F|nr:alpha-crystallin domain-containing protein 22.3-like [Capsicum annuum]
MRNKYPSTYKAKHVVQTGEAQEGRAGVPSDPVTITITAIYYKFKVALPAVARSLDDLSVDVLPNGDVKVEGIVRAAEMTSSVGPTVCNKGTRRIFPQGHFTIRSTLLGPAEPMFVRTKLNSNGVLEGAIFKHRISRSHYTN